MIRLNSKTKKIIWLIIFLILLVLLGLAIYYFCKKEGFKPLPTTSKKPIPDKENNISAVDYKDVKLLKRFTNDNGKIMPRRVTGTSAKMHRKVVGAIKRARTIGLMPFVDSGSE